VCVELYFYSPTRLQNVVTNEATKQFYFCFSSSFAWEYNIRLSSIKEDIANCILFVGDLQEKSPWPESVSELYRLSDRSFSAKLVRTSADRRCHVVSLTDPYGRIIGILSFFQVARQLYSRVWVDPVPENVVAPGIEPGPLDLWPGTLITKLQRRCRRPTRDEIKKVSLFDFVHYWSWFLLKIQISSWQAAGNIYNVPQRMFQVLKSRKLSNKTQVVALRI
jgi:hypothetical protein